MVLPKFFLDRCYSSYIQFYNFVPLIFDLPFLSDLVLSYYNQSIVSM